MSYKIANCIGGRDPNFDAASCSKCARGYVKQKVPNGIDQCHQVYTCNNGLAKEHATNVPGQRLNPGDTVPPKQQYCIRCDHNYDLRYLNAGPSCVKMTAEEIRRRGCPKKLKAAPKEHPYLNYDSNGDITGVNVKKIAISCAGVFDNANPLCLEDKAFAANKFWNQVKAVKTPDYCLTLDESVSNDGDKCDGFYNPDTLDHCGNTGDWDHPDIGEPGECSGTGKKCHGTLYCDEHEVTRRPAYKKCEDFDTYPSLCDKYYGEADPDSGINPFCKAAERDSDRYASSTPCVSEGDLDSGGHGCYDRCIAEAEKIYPTCTKFFEDKMRENGQDPYNDFSLEVLQARRDHCNTCVRNHMNTAAYEGDGPNGKYCSENAINNMCDDKILKGVKGNHCTMDDECQSKNCQIFDLDPAGDVNKCPEKYVRKRMGRGTRRVRVQMYGENCDQECSRATPETTCRVTAMCSG